jgi:hypothetical protein
MHVAGLPRHPATRKEMPPTPYQLEFVNTIIKAVTKPEDVTEDEWQRLHHMFHIVKGRQMGFTEIVLRLLFHFCFTRYPEDSNIGIMAATTGALARKDLRRFASLFKHITSVVEHWVKSTREGVCMRIINGITIWAYSAAEEAVTGDTNYVAFFMDESAKWKLVDDTGVFNSVLPIIRSNGADLFLLSTFKGPQKMFYKIWKDPQEFIKFEFTIWRAEGNLYTKPQIENMLATSKEDPDQEYLCKPTIGQDAILGTISDDDRADYSEWTTEDYDPEEDDNYKDDEIKDEW